MSSEERIAKARAAMDGITPLPWQVLNGVPPHGTASEEFVGDAHAVALWDERGAMDNPADSQAIVAVMNAAPDLFALIDEQASTIADVRAMVVDLNAKVLAMRSDLTKEITALFDELTPTPEEAHLLITLLVNDTQGRGQRLHAPLIGKLRTFLTKETA